MAELSGAFPGRGDSISAATTWSDKPKGVENYDMRLLVGDVAAVVKHLKAEPRHHLSATTWGGIVPGRRRCACRRWSSG
jgi:hypothetical protein